MSNDQRRSKSVVVIGGTGGIGLRDREVLCG